MQYKTSLIRVAIEFTTTEDLSYNTPFSMTELTSAIGGLGHVAVGSDCFHGTMFQIFTMCALHALLNTSQALSESGQFPSAMQEEVSLQFSPSTLGLVAVQ